jgi:hypothetical protein
LASKGVVCGRKKKLQTVKLYHNYNGVERRWKARKIHHKYKSETTYKIKFYMYTEEIHLTLHWYWLCLTERETMLAEVSATVRARNATEVHVVV